jgi:hypothetical protein
MSNSIGGKGVGRRVSDGAFDSAVTAVARKRNGDAVTPDLFWDIALALDTDAKARHKRVMALLEDHVAADVRREAATRDEITDWRANHVAMDHAPLPQSKAERDWTEWGWKIKATVAIGGVIGFAAIDQIVRIASHVFMGYP